VRLLVLNRVSSGKAGDLPIYFGDAGSPAVLHSVGAERAACAVITLDTPGANYRSVWAMHKHFPSIKTYVRAHDVNHGINLEKAGATVVVPETLEPSMQLAANVLLQFKLPPEEINTHLDNFRKKHLRELQALATMSGVWEVLVRWCGSVVCMSAPIASASFPAWQVPGVNSSGCAETRLGLAVAEVIYALLMVIVWCEA
jgi:hypothetical protein